jgi:hypothetical protein
MTKLFENKKWGAIEYFIVCILIALAYGAASTVGIMITPDGDLAPLVPYVSYIQYVVASIIGWVAYQVLSKEGYTIFQEKTAGIGTTVKEKVNTAFAAVTGKVQVKEYIGMVIEQYKDMPIAKITDPEYWTYRLKVSPLDPDLTYMDTIYNGEYKRVVFFHEPTGTMWSENPDPWGIIAAAENLKKDALDAFNQYIKLNGCVEINGIMIAGLTGDKYDEYIEPWVKRYGALAGITEYKDCVAALQAANAAKVKANAEAAAKRAADEQAARDKQFAETMEKAKLG